MTPACVGLRASCAAAAAATAGTIAQVQ